MRWAVVQYVQTLPCWASGVTYGPWVRILLRCKEDQGLLEHELLHVRQFWYSVLAFTCWVPVLTYMPWPWALALLAAVSVVAFAQRRVLVLMAETDAYRLQLRVTARARNLSPPEVQTRAELFAGFLATRYGLNITPAQALSKLL